MVKGQSKKNPLLFFQNYPPLKGWNYIWGIVIGYYNNLYSSLQYLLLKHVYPRLLRRDFLVIVSLCLGLITIPYLNKKEEIGSHRCLENLIHHRIAYSGLFLPWVHEILWHPDMTLAWFTSSHFHISLQRSRCSLVCLLNVQSSVSLISK